MNTAVINLKTDPKTKKAAQKVAEELGMSLSSLINGFLKDMIQTKSVYFSADEEVPSAYMMKALKENEKDRKAGRISPSFTNIKDEIAWLNDPNARYENGDKVRP